MDFSRFTLTPAYGKDYNSKAKVIEALNAGKDFMANGPDQSTLCSIRDISDGVITVRYFKRTKLVLVQVKGGKAS